MSNDIHDDNASGERLFKRTSRIGKRLWTEKMLCLYIICMPVCICIGFDNRVHTLSRRRHSHRSHLIRIYIKSIRRVPFRPEGKRRAASTKPQAARIKISDLQRRRDDNPRHRVVFLLALTPTLEIHTSGPKSATKGRPRNFVSGSKIRRRVFWVSIQANSSRDIFLGIMLTDQLVALLALADGAAPHPPQGNL